MSRITRADVDGSRALALFYLAHPEYRNGELEPRYFDRGMDVAGSGHRLRPIIDLSREAVIEHCSRHGIPADFKEVLADSVGPYDTEDIMQLPVPEIVGYVYGDACFSPLARDYIARQVMKRRHQEIKSHIPEEALDRYALQMLEQTLVGRHMGPDYQARAFGHRFSADKFHDLWFLGIPKATDDGGRRPLKHEKFKLGQDSGWRKHLSSFAVNTYPAARRNLAEYRGMIDSQVARDRFSDMNESARVLGI